MSVATFVPNSALCSNGMSIKALRPPFTPVCSIFLILSTANSPNFSRAPLSDTSHVVWRGGREAGYERAAILDVGDDNVADPTEEFAGVRESYSAGGARDNDSSAGSVGDFFFIIVSGGADRCRPS